ncbi:energy transducer TonB [Enterobacter sp. Ap-916]|uniref:cell envelope integrity protein TolA n=1 Tax=unclassified Enterobacter TaxID=2608935 RepID=UPI001424412C|nr:MULTISPECIES: energy transducer TonB [unclassified Enterobacter]NIF58110.1 energy transducer TonB [Enterobacter sp. Ap-867]NIG27948.1 energy transducer TonB [Enterobacter sp. Ap-916]
MTDTLTPSLAGRSGTGFTLSLLLHGGLFLALIWQVSDTPSALEPAPAVMLQWADDIEAPPTPVPLPVGIAQQESAAAEEKQQAEDKQQQPLPIAKDAVIEVTRRKKAAEGEKKKPRPPRNVREQTSDSSQAAISTNAAPQPSVVSSRIAAPYHSDAEKQHSQQDSWESRVKGHLNRFKRYPGDARQRARTGIAVVTFTVDAAGKIVASSLTGSSGTRSLDREAVAVLERAQPLPKPPVERLKGGVYNVTMPINFDLTELSRS